MSIIRGKSTEDLKNLREAGVPQRIIDEIDARDGGNIAPDGTVLFLDAERQKRKEQPGKAMRANSTNGIRNIATKFGAFGFSRGIITPKLFATAVGMTKLPPKNPIGKAMYEILGFGKKGYNHFSIIPLNVDLSEASQNTIVPIDFMLKEVEEQDYIAIMDHCLCRQAANCEHYPHDFGCIFMGPVGKATVKNGLAKRATVEEAKAHILKAAELGLMGATEFVEGEQLFWGVKNDVMHTYRMFCFCCDCCCLSLAVPKYGSWDTRERYRSVGWTATVDRDKCIGCGKCEEPCPMHCIEYQDGKRFTDQERCVGCGFCKQVCPTGAVKIKQTMPARESINDYYLAEGRIDDQLPHEPAVHVDPEELRRELQA